MKPGDKVYVATTQGVDEFYFVSFEGMKANLSASPLLLTHYNGFWVRKSHVFEVKTLAIQFRIELLKKSIRTMETTTANHQRTIRQLQRELRESSAS